MNSQEGQDSISAQEGVSISAQEGVSISAENCITEIYGRKADYNDEENYDCRAVCA